MWGGHPADDALDPLAPGRRTFRAVLRLRLMPLGCPPHELHPHPERFKNREGPGPCRPWDLFVYRAAGEKKKKSGLLLRNPTFLSNELLLARIVSCHLARFLGFDECALS